MKQKASFVIVYWWLLLLFLGGLCLLAFAPKAERISETENRTLSGFPALSPESLTSGAFFLGIEGYLSDGVWGRDRIVGASEALLGRFSVNTAQEENLLSDAAMTEQLQGLAGGEEVLPEASVEADIPPAEVLLPEQGTEMEGWGLWRIRRDGGYERVTAVGEEDLEIVAKVLNGYKACLPEDGAVFYTSVPLSGTALATRGAYAGWVENIDEGLSQYTGEGVHILNTPALLAEALWAGEKLFFTADHHWTPRGAQLVVSESIRLLGLPTLPYEEYDYTLRHFSNPIKDTTDDLELMHPLQPVSGRSLKNGVEGLACDLINYAVPTYRAYLNGDSPVWTRYTTGFSTGRRALVIGDSFSNAFTPYLMPYYDEVYKVDARYYDPRENGGTIGELIGKYAVDDVYIILSQANGVRSLTSQKKLEAALYG